ncbi:MAG: CheR family methyltransferase [Pseudomonadota bacterium]
MFETTTGSAYAQLLELLRLRIGLDPSSAGTGALPTVLESMGMQDEQSLQAFVQAARYNPALLDPITVRIVVHETWFFREPAAFAVLVDAAHRCIAEGRRFRVLSAPCSTGEEAYSIAIALTDAGVDMREVDIVAIDISPAAILQARRGRFSEIAFRGLTPEWRDTRFIGEDRLWRPRSGDAYSIQFEVANLLALPASIDSDRFDAVFCRNLLIYLDDAARQKVWATLRKLTRAEQGLIFVGHAESTDAFAGALERVHVPMSFAFWNRAIRKVPAAPAYGATLRNRPLALSPRPSVAHAAPAAIVARVAPLADPLEPVRQLADRGRLSEAIALCNQLLERFPASADAHCYRGVLAVASGEAAAAKLHFGRALYLDPRHQQALQHMALLVQSDADDSASRRYLERLMRLRQPEPPGSRA